MDAASIIADLIPLNNYQHRNGFNNKPLIDKLDNNERILVEHALLKKLFNTDDRLIVETLACLKSVKSVPLMLDLLEQISDNMARIMISASVFTINVDPGMVEVSTNSFRMLTSTYQKISAFYYLRKFKNAIADASIEGYIKNPDTLLSRALGL